MDISLVIKQRLEHLGLEQKDLAAAAGVTESYISQLLSRKKMPPAPNRTDIYVKMGRILKLPNGRLSEMAELQRNEELKRELLDPPPALQAEVRELILRKCAPDKVRHIRTIFEAQPLGELERLVTQKILEVVKRVARGELESENWLHLMARLSGRTYEEVRVNILEFLDTDIFQISAENCVSFLEPMVESWDIDLATFGMEVILNRRLATGYQKRLEFVEKEPEPALEGEGFLEFLNDKSLSGSVTGEEVEFLKHLRFRGRQPNPLYYYRELQNLRDPLHFRDPKRVRSTR